MKIDGKVIAEDILRSLTTRVQQCNAQGCTPCVAIILVGADPASLAYVQQKELKAQKIGARATVIRLPQDTSEEKLLLTIEQCNNDNNIHGVIVQRPLPSRIDIHKISNAVVPPKDIDAFHPKSPYPMPLAAAVLKILEHINKRENFAEWLKSQRIVIVGKGQTGGGPTIELLKKMEIEPTVVDSKTKNPKEVTGKADILICAVGKQNLITKGMVKKGAILIAVGMYRGRDGKLHGDYEENDIKDIASYYTPIPGGVGPVNVAMLLHNLLEAVKK